MASGDTLLIFLPGQNEPPASNPADNDFQVNARYFLAFAGATANETAVFSGVMPEHYSNATGVDIEINWTKAGTSTNDVDWDVSWERGTTAVDTDSFATANSIDNTAASATTYLPVQTTDSHTAGAQMDSVVAGDHFRLKITRDQASDTLAVDALFMSIHIKET